MSYCILHCEVFLNRARTKPTVLLLSGNSAHLLVLGWIGDMIENDNRKIRIYQ